MIIIKKNIIVHKGKEIPFSFLFLAILLTLMDNCSAQFGAADWLHPATNSETPNVTSSYMQMINNSHLGIISDGAFNISENTYGLNYVKQFQRNMIKIKYKQHQSFTEFSQADYAFRIIRNYQEFSYGYGIDRKIFSANVELKKNSAIQKINPSLDLTAKLQPWLICRYGKSINQVPFNLALNYYGFDYELNNINAINNMYYLGFSLKNKKYQIDYIQQKNVWEINEDDTLYQRIEVDNKMNNKLYFRGILVLKNKNSISWIYKTDFQDMKLKLINDSDLTFLKINQFSNNNHIISVRYKFHYSKYAIHIQYFKRDMDLNLSTRITPSRMNTDLTTLIGLTINNNNNGEIMQEMVSIKLEPTNIKKIVSTIKIAWLKDQYNLDFETMGYIFMIPSFTENQRLDIIGKDAININLSITLKHGNWMVSTNYSQHFPINIKLRSKPTTSGETDLPFETPDYADLTSILNDLESELSGGNYYGGGLFQLSITKYID